MLNDVMDQEITYIRQEAKPGDEISGLGDWFHIYENGFRNCLQRPMTRKFRVNDIYITCSGTGKTSKGLSMQAQRSRCVKRFIRNKATRLERDQVNLERS